MPEKSLRALARQYAKGELDKDAYRRSRAEFIEAVLSGSARLPVNDYPAPRSTARAEATSENTRRRPRRKREAEDVTSVMVTTDPTPKSVAPIVVEPADVPEEPAAESFPKHYIAVAAIAGLLLVAAIVLATRSGAPKSGEVATAAGNPAAQIAAPEPAATTASSGPAIDLIQKFLGDKNWSEPARSEFLNQWQALPEDQRAVALNTGEMAQLNNGIYKKMLEERALSGLGDATASLAKQRSLVEFAAAIGIHDPRLSTPATAVQ